MMIEKQSINGASSNHSVSDLPGLDNAKMTSNTAADDLAKATKDIETSQKTQQALLTTLDKYKQVAELMRQVHDILQPEAAKPDEKAKPQEDASKALIWKNLSQTVRTDRPILFVDGKDFQDMLKRFKDACEYVHTRRGDWSEVKDLSSFDHMSYCGYLSVETMMNMLWFSSAILTRNFAHQRWGVDSTMKLLIESINMLNALEFTKK